MSTEVVMPQMGESIAEGTITRWMKQVGDRVERDEPLFEISTDKVDAEIPSPAAGTLTEIKFKEGETVEVNKVVAIIGAEGEQAAAPAASAQPTAPPAAAQAAVAAEPPPAPVAPPPVAAPQAAAASAATSAARTRRTRANCRVSGVANRRSGGQELRRPASGREGRRADARLVRRQRRGTGS